MPRSSSFPASPAPQSLSAIENSPDLRGSAYLVIHQGGRWTDVYRLMPGRRVVIGRASTSQIVVHSERCSRHHAELFWASDHWVVRDCASRNGTLVNGRKISGDHPLQPGQTVEVAGCQMTYAREISEAFARGHGPAVDDSPAAGQPAGVPARRDDHQTADAMESAVITHRRDSSSFLQPPSSRFVTPSAANGQELFRLAFELARCDSIRQATAKAVDQLAVHLQVGYGAVLIDSLASPTRPAAARDLEVVAACQPPERSYHRLTDLLATTVLTENQAVLARNLRNDAQLATPDSRGQWSTTSMIAAPIRLKFGPVGLIHLYSGQGQRDLTPEDLEFTVAATESLSLAIANLQRQRQLSDTLSKSRRRVDQLRRQLDDATQIIGHSPPIQQVKQQIRRAAPTASTVLVRGESGTGKELVAAAIHQASPRRDAPFVCLNCAALSPTLLESELFGHEKGAFTGATERKLGKFEAADGGTLMLDEIGEMPPEIQAKFLRVLEGHSFERLGGNQPIRADVRVVAATNRDLEQAVREGAFRADLYYRLHVVEIVVPPLRQRGSDVLRIADFFLDRFNAQMGRRLEGMTPEARQRLSQYSWPGNIRELKNVIERAVVLCDAPQIDAGDLTLSDVHPDRQAGPSDAAESFQPLSLLELEQRHIVAVLRATGGNKSRAASILGIERSTLDRKLRRYAIDPASWRQP